MANRKFVGSEVRISNKTADEKPTVVGEPVDIKAWLKATEVIKGKDGKPDETVLSNVSKAVLAVLENATEVKSDTERIVGLQGVDLVAEILNANTKIDVEGGPKPFKMEYVNLRPLTAQGMLLLMGGVMNVTYEGEGEDRREKPSACKYFAVGYGMLARNATAARIRTAVEGPDKAIESAIKDLMRAKGWSREKAESKVKAMLADD